MPEVNSVHVPRAFFNWGDYAIAYDMPEEIMLIGTMAKQWSNNSQLTGILYRVTLPCLLRQLQSNQ